MVGSEGVWGSNFQLFRVPQKGIFKQKEQSEGHVTMGSMGSAAGVPPNIYPTCTHALAKCSYMFYNVLLKIAIDKKLLV